MRKLIICLSLVAGVSYGKILQGALVTVRANGEIAPTGAVASIQQLSASAAQAVAAQAAAESVASANANNSNSLIRIEGEIASQQQHAIFRGWVQSFSSTVAPVTNATSQILSFSMRQEGTNTVADVATWFSTAPMSAPNVRWRSRLTSGSWSYLSALSNTWPATVNIATTGGVYAAYRSSVLVPAAQTSAFYRVDGDIQLISGNDNLLAVSGGLAVNGMVGVTTNLVLGGVTNRFVGGVLVP